MFYFNLNSLGNRVNAIFAVILLITSVGFPLFVGIFYNLKSVVSALSTLYRTDFKRSLGELMDGLNVKRNGRIVLLYPLISLIRRLILVVTCVYLTEFPVFSIFSINFQSQILIMTVGLISPFSLKSSNAMELFNETCVLLINYHLMCFTDFLGDLALREKAGLTLIILTITNIMINLGQISYVNLCKVSRKLYIHRLKVKHQKAA